MLSASGLINYFGKYTNIEKEIAMVPLLISKGETKVAIYGLGALKDKMCHRLFRTEKVPFTMNLNKLFLTLLWLWTFRCT